MKKILIWDNFKLEDRGGQFGYLYQLHSFLEDHPNPQIFFLSDIVNNSQSATNTKKEIGSKFNQINSTKPNIKLRIVRFLSFIHLIWLATLLYKQYCCVLQKYRTALFFGWRQFRYSMKIIPSSIDVNSFDFIHFHFVPTLTRFKKTYPNYKGKLILTSHCPCSWTDEHITYYDPWVKCLRPFALYNECRSYNLADYLMFPCQEAREAYEKVPEIKKVFRRSENKFFYIPTSILDKPVDTDKMQKLSDLGIPEGAFVITYFGRHITIKGYDILKEIAAKLLDKIPNLYFLCAGKGNVVPLEHPRWIELGFIHNANELLLQSDLYILPNRETYFDIITLEVFRSGTKLLLSSTGGNNYFKTLDPSLTKGITYFNVNNIDEIVFLVENSINEKENAPEQYKEYGRINRYLFELFFSMEIYTNSYLDKINSL